MKFRSKLVNIGDVNLIIVFNGKNGVPWNGKMEAESTNHETGKITWLLQFRFQNFTNFRFFYSL